MHLRKVMGSALASALSLSLLIHPEAAAAEANDVEASVPNEENAPNEAAESNEASVPSEAAESHRASAPNEAVEAPRTPAMELEDRLADMEDRLDQAEKKTILDRILWSGEYRTILNAFRYKGPTSNPYDLTDPSNPLSRRRIKKTTSEVWSHRLSLGLSAEPVRSLRLTGRLVMFKHFGDGDTAPFITDFSAARVPRDSALRFDQLWLDWFALDWLAISAGRIAYTEGNPNELRENSTVRRATWGLQMVDGEYETINLTFNLEHILPSLYARLFYASWFFDDDNDVFGGFGFLDSGTDNLRIFGGNLELTIPGVGKNFVQIGFYTVPRFRPFFLPIPDPAFQPSNDPTHAPAPLNGSLLFPDALPDDMGAYQNASALVEFYDFLDSGLDWFCAGAIGMLHPNGRGISYELPVPTADPNEVVRQSTPFLFLASQGDSGTTYFVYAGARYTLPIDPAVKLGFEFNAASRYWISFAQQTDHLTTKLATRGRAYEAYAILPFNDQLFMRASYLLIDSDYQSGFFGPNPAITGSTAPPYEQTIHNVQLILNASL
ncbi:MAG: DUF3373 family protein [Deltaproteobacteria bacterium]|nr:DUF3373 family protein [Deltaproteobacteria bacterium]